MNIIEGNFIANKNTFGIVVSRWNEFIVKNLLDGAIDALNRHGVVQNSITVAYCPGSFELPLIAKKMAESSKYDAIIALGAVIRGSTPHFDIVSSEVSKGIAAVSLSTGVPILNGVITTDNIEQAIERAGSKAGNKGYDAAMAAIEMVNLINALK